jgi:hypothetical protein
MPLRTTPTPPPLLPTVTVLFIGQLLIDSSGATPCNIRVNYKADVHDLSISLIVTEPGKSPSSIILHHGKLQRENFSVKVISATYPNGVPGGVTAYHPGTPNPADELDFSRALSLSLMHQPGSVIVNTGLAEPGIALYNGVLYTHKKTGDALDIALLCGSSTKTLNGIAARIAAALPLAAGQQVSLDWYDSGKPLKKLLPREGDDPGTTYVVSIINEPPQGAPTPHDEMEQYYKVLLKADGSAIGDGEKCQLNVSKHLKANESSAGKSRLVEPEVKERRMTDEIPCMPLLVP